MVVFSFWKPQQVALKWVWDCKGKCKNRTPFYGELPMRCERPSRRFPLH